MVIIIICLILWCVQDSVYFWFHLNFSFLTFSWIGMNLLHFFLNLEKIPE